MPRVKKSDLPISEVRAILLRHERSLTDIAAELGVRLATVSQALSETIASRRIVAAARKKAEHLLREESRQGSAA